MKVRDILQLIEADGWYLVAQKGPRKESSNMSCYLIVIEKANGDFSAYSPDLPGCIATGRTREETLQNMREAIEMHVHGLLEDKLPVPKPAASAGYVAVA
jgi:predicted RNase H-like HicB family nuclease